MENAHDRRRRQIEPMHVNINRTAIAILAALELVIGSILATANESQDYVELHSVRHPNIYLAALGEKTAVLATTGVDGIRVWNLLQGKRLHDLEAHKCHIPFGNGHFPRVTGIQFVDNDSKLVTSGEDGNICIWDVVSGKLKMVFGESIVKSSRDRHQNITWQELYRRQSCTLPWFGMGQSPPERFMTMCSFGNAVPANESQGLGHQWRPRWLPLMI